MLFPWIKKIGYVFEKIGIRRILIDLLGVLVFILLYDYNRLVVFAINPFEKYVIPLKFIYL